MHIKTFTVTGADDYIKPPFDEDPFPTGSGNEAAGKLHNAYTISFALLTPPLLVAMTKQPMYFVRQYYPDGEGWRDDERTPLLFTHYTAHETDRERAERHMRLLFHDKYRFLYYSNNPEHMDRLLKAAHQPEGYRIHVNLLDRKWKPSQLIKKRINEYIERELRWWKYQPNDSVKVTLKDRYGKIYLAIKWKEFQVEVGYNEVIGIKS